MLKGMLKARIIISGELLQCTLRALVSDNVRGGVLVRPRSKSTNLRITGDAELHGE